MELLLYEGDGFSVKDGLLLEEVSVKKSFEESAGFGDDLSSFVVFINLGFEFFLLFSAISIELINSLVDASNFLGLGGDDALEDGALRVESSFELSLKLDAVDCCFTDLFVEISNVVVAGVLEGTVDTIVFLLVCDESIFKRREGFE